MNEKVMVVDDDDLVRSGLAANLERAGFDVLTAANSQEVRELMSRHAVDLAICDLVLGDEDGMDVLRFFQSNHPDISVVIITGHGSVSTALDSLRGGASDYIQKPADPEEVIHRVRTVLDSANLRRSLSQERQKSEARKRIIHDQLSRAERMSSLGVLAEGAASDLKEILQPVQHIPDEVRKKIDPLHECHAHLITLDAALRKASAVIRDLETIGRANGFKKSSLQVNDIITGYLKSPDYLQLFGANPMVRLEMNLADNLPPVAGSLNHLRQMVANIITNAMEGMATGGVLRISTAVERIEQEVGRFGPRRAGEYVAMRFEDTSPRLNDEEIERVFEPFFVRNRLGRRLVSGLGLTMVYRVAEEHEGFVDIEPTAHTQGNIFVVLLPVCAPDEEEVLELRPDYTGRERILLVDDSESQRNEAALMLQELGYDVTTAANGYAALEAMKEQLARNPGRAPFDLMIIDLILGDAFDGVETFKSALALYPGQKAILASGFADITRIVEARKLGIGRSFQKPYTLEVLGKNIRIVLDEG